MGRLVKIRHSCRRRCLPVRSARIAGIPRVHPGTRILELLDAYRVAVFSRLQALELSLAARQAEIELNRAVGEEVLP